MKTNNHNIFEKIINKKIKAEIIFEDKDCIVIKDINPIAPVHLLIIPKKKIISISKISLTDKDLINHLINIAIQQATINNLKNGFRIIINDGKEGGQSINHLHIHLLGGKFLKWHTL